MRARPDHSLRRTSAADASGAAAPAVLSGVSGGARRRPATRRGNAILSLEVPRPGGGWGAPGVRCERGGRLRRRAVVGFREGESPAGAGAGGVTRRRFGRGAATLLAGSLLAACAGAPAASGTAGGATPSPVPAGALAVANMLTSPEQDTIRTRTVATFRERYPQVRVEELTAPFQQYNQKMLAMLADDMLPDVLHLYFVQAAGGPADLAARGALVPLDRYVARDARQGVLGWEVLWPTARRAGTFEGAQVALLYNGVN